MPNNPGYSPTMKFSADLATYAVLSAANKNSPINLSKVNVQGLVQEVNAEKNYIKIIPSEFKSETNITVFLAENLKNSLPKVGDLINLKDVELNASVAGLSRSPVNKFNISPQFIAQVRFESQIENLTKDSILKIEKNVNKALEASGLASLKVTPESIASSLKNGKVHLEAVDKNTGEKATLNLDEKTGKALMSSLPANLTAKVENKAEIKPTYQGASREFSL